MKKFKVKLLRDDKYQGFIFVVDGLNLLFRCHPFAQYEYHFSFPDAKEGNGNLSFFHDEIPSFDEPRRVWKENCRNDLENDLNLALQKEENRHWLIEFIMEDWIKIEGNIK